MDRDKPYVEHILDSIAAISADLRNIDFVDFQGNRMLYSAVVRELEIIGEAAKNLSEDFKTAHPALPWKQITGMRDRLIHHYFEVDLEAVWKTAKEDLPVLKKELA